MPAPAVEDDRPIAVVAGASRGFGADLVSVLADDAWLVIGVCRSQPIRAQVDGRVDLVIADLVADGPSAVAARLAGRPLRLLVNNAGAGGQGSVLAETSSAELGTAFQTNVVAPFEMIKRCEPNLRRARSPLVVNVTSRLGSLGRQANKYYDRPGRRTSYAYRVTKAAQNMLSICLAAELASTGIGIWSVHPGRLTTSMASVDADTDPRAAARRLISMINRRAATDLGPRFISLDDRENDGSDLPW